MVDKASWRFLPLADPISRWQGWTHAVLCPLCDYCEWVPIKEPSSCVEVSVAALPALNERGCYTKCASQFSEVCLLRIACWFALLYVRWMVSL
jgi:hypothetical protein